MTVTRRKLKHDQRVGCYQLNRQAWQNTWGDWYRKTTLRINHYTVRQPLVELGGWLHNEDTVKYLTAKALWAKRAIGESLHFDTMRNGDGEVTFTWQESKERPMEFYGCHLDTEFRDWSLGVLNKIRSVYCKEIQAEREARGGWAGKAELAHFGCEPSPIKTVQILGGMGFVPCRYEKSDEPGMSGGEMVPDWDFDLRAWDQAGMPEQTTIDATA